MDNKNVILESFLSNLADHFNSNPEATDYIQTNIQTPRDLQVFAAQNNIDINYQAPNMQLTTESFIKAIEENL